MQVPNAWRLTAAVWIANIAVTALAITGLEHPKPYVPAADVWQPSPDRPARHVIDNKGQAVSPASDEGATAMVMPMDTIVANEHGRALMQGAPDVVIGPGTVTYPSTNPPRPRH